MMAEQKSRAVPMPRNDAPQASGSTLQAQLRRKLDQGLDGLNLSPSQDQRETLIEYLALLAQWNAVYNLTAVRDPFEMLALHVLDSLAVAHLFQEFEGLDVLDVGTGAGLPGVPLAIILPEHRFQLIDAVAKKIGFLQHVKIALKLGNLHPKHVRIEALTVVKTPEIIVSRAYAELSHMARSVAHLADGSTTVIAMKGVTPSEELAALPASWRVVELRELHVPFVAAHRCAVILRRVS